MDEKQYAIFCRKASDVEELIDCAASPGMQKTRTAFQVEGFMRDQIFLFENGDHMWFDPSEACWHCLLIKGEHSREGILVEAEGYSYARYAAHVPDCSLVRVGEVPVQCEYPVNPPHKKKEVPER